MLVAEGVVDIIPIVGASEDVETKIATISVSDYGRGTACETKTCVSFGSATEAEGRLGVGFNICDNGGTDTKKWMAVFF